jgi:hypothetical protein
MKIRDLTYGFISNFNQIVTFFNQKTYIALYYLYQRKDFYV